MPVFGDYRAPQEYHRMNTCGVVESTIEGNGYTRLYIVYQYALVSAWQLNILNISQNRVYAGVM